MGQTPYDRKVNLLIGCSGAVVKLDSIIESFAKTKKYNIKVVFTEHSRIFMQESISNIDEFQKKNNVEFYNENDEFGYYEKEKEKTCPLFVKLRQWADILLLVPLSANTLAKISHGLCDNLLTHVVRCWDINKTHLFNLAMNPLMYNKVVTEKYIKILTEEFKFIHIPSKVDTALVGNERGVGAVADNQDLLDAIEKVRDNVLVNRKEIPIIRKYDPPAL